LNDLFRIVLTRVQCIGPLLSRDRTITQERSGAYRPDQTSLAAERFVDGVDGDACIVSDGCNRCIRVASAQKLSLRNLDGAIAGATCLLAPPPCVIGSFPLDSPARHAYCSHWF
jgi:hypothetical protein